MWLVGFETKKKLLRKAFQKRPGWTDWIRSFRAGRPLCFTSMYQCGGVKSKVATAPLYHIDLGEVKEMVIMSWPLLKIDLKGADNLATALHRCGGVKRMVATAWSQLYIRAVPSPGLGGPAQPQTGPGFPKDALTCSSVELALGRFPTVSNGCCPCSPGG